jgi:hypothetical protein
MDHAMTAIKVTQNGSLIDTVLVVWFILTALSVLYVAYDAFKNNPELKVMRIGWILVTAYTGVIGAALYVLSCKPPIKARHAQFVTPLWKQALGSTIHCIAGDATGIIVASVITAILGFPLYLDTILEYFFGFLFGLLIFQSLFAQKMLGGSYIEAVKKTFLPEWVSMNMVMAGAIPVMVILMSKDPQTMNATNIRFWGVWSLATLVALVTSYPINVWLVANKLKHGMGTEAVFGKGGDKLTMEE